MFYRPAKGEGLRYEILTIGTELTLGLSVDTNSAFLARQLAQEGFLCTRMTSVADDIDEISNTIKDAFSRSEVLIVTGGLGPTIDDLTRDAISKVFKRKLVYQVDIEKILKAKFKRFGQEMPEIVLRQAYLPEGATAILPPSGTAPGIVLKHSGKLLLALPGVPREIEEMSEQIIQLLKSESSGQERVIIARIIKTYGASEAFIESKVEEIMKRSENPKIGILARLGEVHLELIATASNGLKAKTLLRKTEQGILEQLGDLVFGYDDDTLEKVVGKLLRRNGLRIAVAESCTGGLLGNRLTEVPGSSQYFLGGVTVYANEMKVKLLGVREETLRKHGAVSEEVALEMVRDVRKTSGAEVGLSITGIAGPAGGTASKPVGLVYIGLSTPWEEKTESHMFTGPRQAVKQKAAGTALDLLRRSFLRPKTNGA